MNAALFLDVPFDNDEAWGAFQLNHGITHQTVYENLLRQDMLPAYFPLFDFPREGNTEYLFDHWQTHRSNAALLGLPSIPDLSTYDLNDEAQYNDFLTLHAQVHENENRALGLL